MGSSLRIGIACVVLGAAGAVGLMELFGPSERTMTSHREERSLPVPLPTDPAGAPADSEHAALDALLRRALATPRAEQKESPSAAPDDVPPKEEAAMSPDAMRAYDQAKTLVDDRMEKGTWTEGDRQELRSSLFLLSTERRMELERPLIVAVNAGRVHFQGRGPLF